MRARLKLTKDEKYSYLMSAPGLLFLTAIVLYPLIYALNLSVRKVTISTFTNPPFVGLNNYQNPETQFETHTVQPESAITALQYLVSICPIIMSGIAMFFSVLFYWFVSRSPTYKLLSRDDDGMSDFSDAEVLLRPKF